MQVCECTRVYYSVIRHECTRLPPFCRTRMLSKTRHRCNEPRRSYIVEWRCRTYVAAKEEPTCCGNGRGVRHFTVNLTPTSPRHTDRSRTMCASHGVNARGRRPFKDDDEQFLFIYILFFYVLFSGGGGKHQNRLPYSIYI